MREDAHEDARGLRESEELPARNSLMGMDSPLTGAPSMISYLATVSVSVVVLGPEDHNMTDTFVKD